MPRHLATFVALAVLSACGSSADAGDDGPDRGDAGAGAASTSLTIVVTSDEGVEPRTYDLTCDPVGGDHPQAAQACDAAERAGADVFEPVGGDEACTEIFGGPQVATVTGTFEGKAVDAQFSRANGCEIDRWDRLGTTFFNVPLQ
ncbi:MAG: hypothetical protein JWP31_1693 [Aeromicrobium sp.]|nr:hypothetical protein [Aeromicrobium sp.]